MKIIKSNPDVTALRLAGSHPEALLELIEHRLADVIRAFLEAGAIWSADEFGAFVLVESGDTSAIFSEVGLNEEEGLVGAVWEACTLHPAANAYEVLVLYCGDEGWTFFIPNAPWVDNELQAKLVEEATAETPATQTEGPAGVPF